MAYAPGAGTTRTASKASVGRTAGSNGRTSAGRTGAPAPIRRPTTTFLAGLGIGLAIGAAAALLLAPRTGAETRQALRNRGRKAGARASDVWEDLRLELEATRRGLRRKRRDAKIEIEQEKVSS